MKDLALRFGKIVGSRDAFPIDFDEAWKWIGYSTKGNALRVLEENFKQGEDFDFSLLINQKKQRGGDRKTVKYSLTVDCFKSFCMMAGTEQGRNVRRYFLDVEKKFLDLAKNAQKKLKQDSTKARVGLTDERSFFGTEKQAPGAFNCPANYLCGG